MQNRNPAARAGVFCVGLLGPAYLVWSFATHYGLGWDAPWYVVKLFAVGYAPLPLFVIGIGWLAAGGQLAALAAGRYAPYPAPGERPRRGPLRELMRTLLLAQRHRSADCRGAARGERIALGQPAPRRSHRTVEPAASSPFPRGMCTRASAAPARTIMCDS